MPLDGLGRMARGAALVLVLMTLLLLLLLLLMLVIGILLFNTTRVPRRLCSTQRARSKSTGTGHSSDQHNAHQQYCSRDAAQMIPKERLDLTWLD